MGLSYAPFETIEARPPPPSRIEAIKAPSPDATECNYIIMFFVISVFLIALSDSLKSP